jgi:hypothetical protein
MALGFAYKLEHADGRPADPPVLRSAISTWRAGDTIPLGGRTLRVIAVVNDDAEVPVLVVEEAANSG